MGSLRSERLVQLMQAAPAKFKHLEGTLESTELTGHVVWALFNDAKRADMSGKTLIGAELARLYGITDIDGKFPPSVRETHHCAPLEYLPFKVK